MTTRKTITEIKNKFKTGEIPTGQDYADFIDATFNYIDEALIVQKVNGVAPDAQGNVQTSFQVVDFIPPDAPMSDYTPGSSEFYGAFDPADYTEFITDNPSFEQLKAGTICVRTYYDNVNEFAYQEVDNVRNGVFEASFIRVGENGVFGQLVATVPSGGGGGGDVQLSDDYNLDDSNVALSTAGSTDMFSTLNSSITETNGNVDDLTQRLDESINDLQNDIFELEEISESHTLVKASPTVFGHVKLDDVTIKMHDGGQIYASGSAFTYNGLDHTAEGKALDARAGKVLADNLANHRALSASTGSFGHVKVDGNTIPISSAGVISVNPMAIAQNDFERTNQGKLLDARAGKVLNDNAIAHAGKVASDTELGHVKVDGVTIVADENGVISADGASKDFIALEYNRVDINHLIANIPPHTPIKIPYSYIHFNSGFELLDIDDSLTAVVLKPNKRYRITTSLSLSSNNSPNGFKFLLASSLNLAFKATISNKTFKSVLNHHNSDHLIYDSHTQIVHTLNQQDNFVLTMLQFTPDVEYSGVYSKIYIEEL